MRTPQPSQFPKWTWISTSAQWVVFTSSTKSGSTLSSVQRIRKETSKRNMVALMLELCAVTFLKNLQWQGQLIVGTRGLALRTHPKTSDNPNHLLTLLFSSTFTSCSCLSGTESGWWSEICCLRETVYYLYRAEAISCVWEKGMRLRSAVWLEQLLS